MSRARIRLTIALLSTATMFTASAAWGQTAPDAATVDKTEASASASGEPDQDIVVTATKSARGESLQRVAIAVSALPAETLRAQSLNNIRDVGNVTPGVKLDEAVFASFANFMIRGQGLDGSLFTIEPTVSVVVDGMVHENLLGNILDTYDVESVEVLRGPQGILQGRNATGGVVSFRTRRPTDKLQIEGNVLAGSVGRYVVSGLVAGPIVPDILLAKLSVYHTYTNGAFKDNNSGTFRPALYNPSGTDPSPTGDLVRANIWSVRPTIVLKPASNLSITVLGEYSKQTGNGGPGGRIATPQLGYSVALPSNLPQLFGYTPASGKFNVNLDNIGAVDLATGRIVGEVTWDVGPGVFTSITGWRKVDFQGTSDSDGTPFALLQFPKGNRTRSTQFSEEVRFASDFSDVIRFVVGGYYSKLSINTVEYRNTNLLLTGSATNSLLYQFGRFRQDGTSKAIFYNVDVEPIKGFTLSHGGRYTDDEKQINMVPISVCGTAGFINCPNTSTLRSANFHNFSPRFAAQYQVDPRTMIYASYTEGYRSGVFNSRATSVAAIGPAQPETVRSFEAGIKTTLAGGRARINLAAFSETYIDMQRTISVNGIQTLGNAGRARLQGFELETTFRPVDGLTLNGNLSYIKPRFLEFFGLDVDGNGYNPSVDPGLAKNLRFNRVSEWNSYAAIAYTFRLGGEDKLTIGANHVYRSSQFLDTLNELRQPAVNMFGANIRYVHGQWSVNVFGKNLTKVYFADGGTRLLFGPGPNNRAYYVYGGEPREVGVELRFKY